MHSCIIGLLPKLFPLLLVVGPWPLPAAIAQKPAGQAATDKKGQEAQVKVKGLVQHEGRWLRVADKEQLDKGFVHHPQSGEWIKKDELENAQKGLFPLGGQWVPVADANKSHSSWENPWRLMTDNVVLVTNCEFATAETIARECETALGFLLGIVYDPSLPLPKRATICAFHSEEEYREFGARADDTGYSSYGAFWAANTDNHAVACFYGQKDWGPYYLKHAVGLAAAAVLLPIEEIPNPHWLRGAFAGYCERWSNEASCKHFAPQYLQKGGIRSLKSFFKSFGITGEMAQADIDWNIYQAGIFLSYMTKGPDKKTIEAWEKVRTAIREGKGFKKPVDGFEDVLKRSEQKLRDHLQKLAG